MKRLSLFSLALLFLTVSAHAQNPPVIASVEPSSGSVTGGTLVTLSGERLGLPPNFACVLPCPAKVRFGSAEVTALDEFDSYITVRTPAHPAGIVDVTVTTGDNRSVTAANAFTFVTTQEPGYKAFLLPIYTDGDVAGAHGSLWRTEFWIRNHGTRSLSLAPWDCPAGQVCPAVVPLTRTLQPQESLRNLPAFLRAPTGNPGRMLFVTREGSAQVSAALRLWDVSRQSLDAGTEIPVVGEEDFLTTTAHLMPIAPWDANFRLTLRIYEVANTESRFRIRVYALNESVSTTPPFVTMDVVARTADEGPFRLQPAYVQISDFGVLETPGIHPPLVRIEIEPLTPGSLFWAFAASTNNDTQRVTLVTPQ